MDDGWSLDDWNDDGSSVGWHEDWEQTCETSVNPLSIESFDFVDQSGPRRAEWVKMNLDTGGAMGDGGFYDWIPDGEAWQFFKDTTRTVCPDL